MGKRLAAVGFSCMDVYEKLGRSYPTGNGVDWGVHLARMGQQVSVVSVVGEDSFGDQMFQALGAEGIDVTHLRRESGNTCVMYMGLKDGVDRVHLRQVEGVMANFALTPEDERFVLEHDMVHTDLFGHVLGYLPQWHQAGIEVVMDFSVYSEDPTRHCEDLFPYVDYAFMSCGDTDEARVRQWIRHVQALGPKVVTATRGEKGSISFDDKGFHECGIRPAHVVNTVGAGDSYIAGFTYGLLKGWDVEQCMDHGAEVSAKTIEKLGPY